MRQFASRLLSATAAAGTAATAGGATVDPDYTVTVAPTAEGRAIGDSMYGVFLEDINFAADRATGSATTSTSSSPRTSARRRGANCDSSRAPWPHHRRSGLRRVLLVESGQQALGRVQPPRLGDQFGDLVVV